MRAIPGKANKSSKRSGPSRRHLLSQLINAIDSPEIKPGELVSQVYSELKHDLPDEMALGSFINTLHNPEIGGVLGPEYEPNAAKCLLRCTDESLTDEELEAKLDEARFKIREQHIMTILDRLIRENGFKYLADYIWDLHKTQRSQYDKVMKALDTPQVRELLEGFMRQKEGVKAFRDQLKLEPHDVYIKSLGGYSRRRPIEVLLGHFFTTQTLPLCKLSIFCYKAYRAQQRQDFEKFKSYLKIVNYNYDYCEEDIQKLLAAKISPFFENENNLYELFKNSQHDLYLAAKQAYEISQTNLHKGQHFGDLKSLGLQMSQLTERLEIIGKAFRPENGIIFAHQLNEYITILNEQLELAETSREQHPGPGHAYYADVKKNFYMFFYHLNATMYQKELVEAELVKNYPSSTTIQAFLSCRTWHKVKKFLRIYHKEMCINIEKAAELKGTTEILSINGALSTSHLFSASMPTVVELNKYKFRHGLAKSETQPTPIGLSITNPI